MRKIFIIFLFFFLFFLGIGNYAFAQSGNNSEIKIEVQAVNPGDDYRYVLKRLGEKIRLLILSFSAEKKADYYIKLMTVRISELDHVVGDKDIANIQTASQRYAATSGELADFVLSKNLSSYKEKVKNLFESHIPYLEKLRDTYPYISSEWRFVQDDANSLKSHISKLSEKQ